MTNTIEIKAPRWRDRTILVAPWKVGFKNKIVITAKRADGSLYYPEPLYMWGETISKYPKTPIKTRTGRTVLMYVIKLDEVLEKMPWLPPLETGTTPATKTQKLPGVSVSKPNDPLSGQIHLLVVR